MATYTDPEPASGAELISVSQPLITGNFTYLHESYGKDHNFTSASNTSPLNGDGYHKVIHFINQGGDPAPNTGGQLYTKTISGKTQLFYENEIPNIFQLTGPVAPSATTPGYSILPGGMVIQWGGIVSAPNFSPGQTGTVTFPLVFPTSVFIVLTSLAFTTAPPSNANPATVAYDSATLTTSKFDWSFLSASNSYTEFSWIAIGR